MRQPSLDAKRAAARSTVGGTVGQSRIATRSTSFACRGARRIARDLTRTPARSTLEGVSREPMSLRFDTRKVTSRSSPLWKSVRVDTVGISVLGQRTREEAGPPTSPTTNLACSLVRGGFETACSEGALVEGTTRRHRIMCATRAKMSGQLAGSTGLLARGAHEPTVVLTSDL